MKLDRWALIAEIASATVVVISVFVLIIEVRNNTDALRIESVQQASNLWSEVNRSIVEIDGLADILNRKFASEPITPEEDLRARSFYTYALSIMNNNYNIIRSGYLSEEDAEAISYTLRFAFSSVPLIRDQLSTCEECYTEGFKEWIGY